MSYTSIQRMKLEFVSYAGGFAWLHSLFSCISFGSRLLLLMDVSQGIQESRKVSCMLYVPGATHLTSGIEKYLCKRTYSSRQVAVTDCTTDSHYIETCTGNHPEANLFATHLFGGHWRATHAWSVQHTAGPNPLVPDNLQCGCICACTSRDNVESMAVFPPKYIEMP